MWLLSSISDYMQLKKRSLFPVLALVCTFPYLARSQSCGSDQIIEPVRLDFERTYGESVLVGVMEFGGEDKEYPKFFRRITYNGGWSAGETYHWYDCGEFLFNNPKGAAGVNFGGSSCVYSATTGSLVQYGMATASGAVEVFQKQVSGKVPSADFGCTFDAYSTLHALPMNTNVSPDSPTQITYSEFTERCGNYGLDFIASTNNSTWHWIGAASGAVIVSLSEEDTASDAIANAITRGGFKETDNVNSAYYFRFPYWELVWMADLKVDAEFEGCPDKDITIFIEIEETDLMSAGPASVKTQKFQTSLDSNGHVTVSHAISASLGKHLSVKRIYAVPAGGCASSSGHGYGSGGQVNSLHWYGNIGNLYSAESVGQIRVDADAWTEVTFTPADLLFYNFSEDAVEEVRESGQLKQILTPNDFVNIVTIDSDSYRIDLHDPSHAGTPNPVTGVYAVSDTAHSYYQFDKVTDGSLEKLEITESLNGSTKVRQFYNTIETVSGEGEFGVWGMVEGSGDRTILQKRLTLTSPPSGFEAGTYVRIVEEIRSSTNTLVQNIVRLYQIDELGDGTGSTAWFGGDVEAMAFERLRQEEFFTTDPDVPAYTVTYTYGTDSAASDYRRLVSKTDTRGSWEKRTYHSDGNLHKIIRPWLNSEITDPESSHEVVETTLATLTVATDGVNGQLQTRSRSVLGQPIRKSFTLTYTDLQTISGISVSREDSITGATPSANWNSAGNRVVSEWKYADEASEFFNETYAIVNADGTGTVRLLSRDGQDNLVVTERIGAIVDPSAPLLVNAGRETVYTYSGSVQLIDKETTDVTSSLVIASETYSSFDALGRPQRIDYLDGTYETRQYACCGLDSATGRDGVQTTYGYDSLGRVEDTTNSAGTARQLVTRKIYDAAGSLKDRWIGEDATSLVLVEENDYNLDGTLTAKRERYLDAAPSASREQTESATTDAQGYRITTNTLANGSTLIERTYRDGNPYETSGTAVHGQRNAYAIELDNDLGYTVETHTRTALNADGSLSSDYTKEFTNALGQVYRVERPASDGSAAVSKYTYNSGGQLKVSEDPDGQLTLYDYNSLGKLEVTALDMDEDLEIDFDGQDRITLEIESFTTRTDGQDTVTVQSRTVEVWGTDDMDSPEIISQTDQSLSALGQTLPLSKIWSTQYGQLTTTTATIDRANATVTRRSVYPDLSWEEQESVDGYLTRQTRADNLDATLSEQTFTYDAENRVYKVIDIHRGTTTTTYFGDGQVKSVLTPDPDSTQTGDGYDPQLTTYSYTDNLASGISQTTTLPDGISQIVETFHSTGELASKEGALTYPVAYTYDHSGRLFTQTTWQDKATPAGETLTAWEYYPGGLLKQKWYDASIDGNGTITGTEGPAYTYSDAGRLATRTNARGTVTTYSYDPDTKDLTGISHDDGTTPGVSYAYDRQGRIKSVTDASGRRQLTYENGVLADESYVDDENPATEDPFLGLAIDRRQDSLGRFDQIRLLNSQQSELHKVGYTFDEASRIETVTQGSNTATYGYDPAAAIRQTITFNNGTSDVLTVSRAFDDLDRQTSQTSALAGGPTKSYSYLYNDLNQRTRMTFADNGYWQYSYDSLGQVNSAERRTDSGTVIPGYSYGFTFDDIGNRENATLNGRSADYTANLLNQYIERDIPRAVDVRGTANAAATVTVDGQSTTRTGEHFYRELDFSGEANPDDARSVEYLVTGTLPDGGYNNSPRIADAEGDAFLKANPEDFVHDADGNLTNDGRWIYSWNADNRLVAMQTLAGAAAAGVENLRLEFAYDSQGRRFEKKVLAWDGQAYVIQLTTRFLYDGWNHIAELDSQGDLIRGYAWGTDLSGTLQGAGGVGGLVFVSDAATGLTLAPFYDGNGNVMGYADSGSGEIVAEFEYGPFGETIRATGPMADGLNIRFSTKFTDLETGLLYYGYRYYNPGLGRWLSRDLIGESGGLNLYGMVDNDLGNYIDYLGLDKTACIKAIEEAWRYAKENLIPELAKYDPVADGIGGHPIAPNKGGGLTKPGGHYDKIKNFQRGLKERLRKVVKDCKDPCDPKGPLFMPYPTTLDDLANRHIPSPVFIPSSNGLSLKQKFVIGFSIGATGAIIVGQFGPQVAFPEEVITAPASGLIVGLGAVVGIVQVSP